MYVSDSTDADSSDSVVYPALASFVPTVAAEVSDKKSNKRHACVYCQKLVLKVARHMTRNHTNEVEVNQILSMPVGSKERRSAWGKLLKEGDFAHNFEAVKDKKGTVIPQYRTKTSNVDNLVPCPDCKGMYTKKYLYQHHQRCKKDVVRFTLQLESLVVQGPLYTSGPQGVG